MSVTANSAREDLIAGLADCLRPLEFVHAAWLEGADPHERVDEYSDIDLWVDVADGREDRALEAVRTYLEESAPLELCIEVDHPHPLVRQAFYRPGGVPEFLIVDTCVQSHSRQYTFTEERTLVLFDKGSVVRYRDLDEEELRAESLARLGRLESRLAVYPTWVRKEVARGKFLEALGAYHEHVLNPLVEALRLMHTPTKVDFHLKGASADLPPEVAAKLEAFYGVRQPEEIADVLPPALEMLTGTLAEIRDSLGEDAAEPRREVPKV